MMAYNNFERKSVKWWRKVIFFCAEGDGYQKIRAVQQTPKCGENIDPEGVLSPASDIIVPRYSGEASSHSTSR